MSSLLFPGQLVQLGPALYATHAAYYRKPCKQYTREHAEALSDIVVRITKELDLRGHRFVLKALRSVYNGLTMPASQTAFVDPRRPLDRLTYTLCHEALHLQQVQEERLVWDAKRQVFMWEGQLYQISDNSAKESKWRELPWEVDVFAKEVDLYRKISGENEVPVIYGRP